MRVFTWICRDIKIFCTSWFKLFIKLYFSSFQLDSAVSLRKTSKGNQNPSHKHGTYIETAHSAIYIVEKRKKNTQSTVEQSSTNYENNGNEGYITRLPRGGLRFQNSDERFEIQKK